MRNPNAYSSFDLPQTTMLRSMPPHLMADIDDKGNQMPINNPNSGDALGAVITNRTPTRPKGRTHIEVWFPYWLIDLLPHIGRTRVLTAATIVGSRSDGTLVRRGQVSVAGPCRSVRLSFSDYELETLAIFAKQAKLAKLSSTIRTAAMIGFGVPYAYDGVISAPHDWEITPAQCNELLIQSNMLTLGEYRLIALMAPPVIVHEKKQPPWLVRLLADPTVKQTDRYFHRRIRDRFLSDAEVAAGAIPLPPNVRQQTTSKRERLFYLRMDGKLPPIRYKRRKPSSSTAELKQDVVTSESEAA